MKVVVGEDYWYLKKYLDRLNGQQSSGSKPPELYPTARTTEDATQTV